MEKNDYEIPTTYALDEDEYIAIPEAYYAMLLEAEQHSRECRYLGVEEFRLWVAARHPEVQTVEGALHTASLDELREWLESNTQLYYGCIWSLIYYLENALRRRERSREKELAALTEQKVVMPDG